jgi:exosortase/archaeosortase family protein
MSCVGYGVYSFWAAYVIANTGSALKKAVWVSGGILCLWLINVARISMFLVAINQNKTMPLGIDHHTWFTIVAYAFIFGMIYVYDKNNRSKELYAN